MDKKTQGRLLRAWREHIGERRGIKLSQQEVADAIHAECDRLGIDPKTRGLPRTRESLARWELGEHRQSMEGLAMIADVYGISAVDLMQAPPSSTVPSSPTKPAEYDEIQAVDDALRALKKKLQKA